MKTAVLVSLLLLQLLQIPGLLAELRTSDSLIQCLEEMGHDSINKRIQLCPEEIPTCTISVTMGEIKVITQCGRIVGQILHME
ncbi:unnamed protein product [Auanema sp. JU1783]|nr:unnamed protein product [Auanema sp. JU1783]